MQFDCAMAAQDMRAAGNAVAESQGAHSSCTQPSATNAINAQSGAVHLRGVPATAQRTASPKSAPLHPAGVQPTSVNAGSAETAVVPTLGVQKAAAAQVAELKLRLGRASTRSRSLEEQLSLQSMLAASLIESCQEYRRKVRAVYLNAVEPGSAAGGGP